MESWKGFVVSGIQQTFFLLHCILSPAWLMPAGLQGDLSNIVNLDEYSKVQSSTFNVACPMSRLTPPVRQCCDTHFAPS